VIIKVENKVGKTFIIAYTGASGAKKQRKNKQSNPHNSKNSKQLKKERDDRVVAALVNSASDSKLSVCCLFQCALNLNSQYTHNS